MSQNNEVTPGYEPLDRVLRMALDQAQAGKGKERHATDRPFIKQPMLEIGRMVGTGYTAGQAMKKTQEAMRLPAQRAIAECLGAINYLAGTILLLEEAVAWESKKLDCNPGTIINAGDLKTGTISSLQFPGQVSSFPFPGPILHKISCNTRVGGNCSCGE